MDEDSGERGRTSIHGGYETKDRLDFLLKQITNLNPNKGAELLHYLRRAYFEVLTMSHGKGMKDTKALLNKATEALNNMNKPNKYGGNRTMTPELFQALHNLEEDLRVKASPHLMPAGNDPRFAIWE